MKRSLPSESEIIALHRKYAPSEELFNLIYTDCLAVWKIAEQLIHARMLNIDYELVQAGCLLHDIGTYVLIQPDEPLNTGHIRRGIAGEELLMKENMSDELCEIVARHVGYSLTKERIEATFTPLPH